MIDMVNIIKRYLKNNNYNGQGLVDYLNSISRKKAYWLARNGNGRSGIFRVGNTKYYFYCVKPWTHCPNGKVIVEQVRR